LRKKKKNQQKKKNEKEKENEKKMKEFLNSNYSLQCDLFSIGVLLLEIFKGEPLQFLALLLFYFFPPKFPLQILLLAD